MAEQATGIVPTLSQHASEIIQAMRDAAPIVTEALVRLTFAQGVSKLVFGGLMLLVVIGCLITSHNASKKPAWDDSSYDSLPTFAFFQRVGCFFIGTICLFVGFNNIADGIIYVVAPEGQTIINVIQAMRGAAQ